MTPFTIKLNLLLKKLFIEAPKTAFKHYNSQEILFFKIKTYQTVLMVDLNWSNLYMNYIYFKENGMRYDMLTYINKIQGDWKVFSFECKKVWYKRTMQLCNYYSVIQQTYSIDGLTGMILTVF